MLNIGPDSFTWFTKMGFSHRHLCWWIQYKHDWSLPDSSQGRSTWHVTDEWLKCQCPFCTFWQVIQLTGMSVTAAYHFKEIYLLRVLTHLLETMIEFSCESTCIFLLLWLSICLSICPWSVDSLCNDLFIWLRILTSWNKSLIIKIVIRN